MNRTVNDRVNCTSPRAASYATGCSMAVTPRTPRSRKGSRRATGSAGQTPGAPYARPAGRGAVRGSTSRYRFPGDGATSQRLTSTTASTTSHASCSSPMLSVSGNPGTSGAPASSNGTHPGMCSATRPCATGTAVKSGNSTRTTVVPGADGKNVTRGPSAACTIPVSTVAAARKRNRIMEGRVSRRQVLPAFGR